MHRTLSHLKEKLIPHRAKRGKNPEKNRDYVVVDKPGIDHVCSPQELIDPSDVRCSVTPMRSNQPFEVADLIDMQSTRSSVECDALYGDPLENRDSLTASSTMSTTSPSSTNSSGHEFSGIDRSILDDTEYSLCSRHLVALCVRTLCSF